MLALPYSCCNVRKVRLAVKGMSYIEIYSNLPTRFAFPLLQHVIRWSGATFICCGWTMRRCGAVRPTTLCVGRDWLVLGSVSASVSDLWLRAWNYTLWEASGRVGQTDPLKYGWSSLNFQNPDEETMISGFRSMFYPTRTRLVWMLP